MFETMMPTGSGFAYIFGADADDAPVVVQRIGKPLEGSIELVNVIPTDGGMTHQAFILPLFNAIESL